MEGGITVKGFFLRFVVCTFFCGLVKFLYPKIAVSSLKNSFYLCIKLKCTALIQSNCRCGWDFYYSYAATHDSLVAPLLRNLYQLSYCDCSNLTVV